MAQEASTAEDQDPPGFFGKRRRGGKSVWDWLDLLSKLAIPVVIAVVAGLLARQQHEFDAQRATDQQNADVLQSYIDKMQDLLLNPNLKTSKPGDPIRESATVQTLTTLRRLDAGRNGTVLQFLRYAGLIGTQDAAVSLTNADLSGAHLDNANLSGIDLSRAILNGATLSGTDLRNATLIRADLSNTDLSGANLSSASLSTASLNGAHINGARLTSADLSGTDLGGADLSGTNAPAANLSGADLNGADLSGANLSGADLSGADLSGADVSDADFSDATLSTPLINQQQLDGVYSCTNTILATGTKCIHNPNITLTYWYTESPPERRTILRLIDQFEHLNPHIIINPVYVPFYTARNAFISAAQAGEAPDVLRSDVGWVTEFASQHYLLNINSYVSPIDLSDYQGGPLKGAPLVYDEYNGYLYGLPQVTDFLALLYNKAYISSPPRTMFDFETDAKNATRSTAPGAPTYGFETNGLSYYTLPFLWAFGGGMLDQHGNILVNSPGSKAGLEFLLRLQNRDKVMPPQVGVGAGGQDMVQDFMSGRTAMIIDGPFDILRILTGTAFRRHPGNLGVAGIPTCPPHAATCHTGQTGSPLGGQSYVISASTGHPNEAYNFIRFMSSEKSQAQITRGNHTFPTRASAYRDSEVTSDPVVQKFLPFMPTARTRPAIPQGAYLFDKFDPSIQLALEGRQNPGSALDTVAAAWDKLLRTSPADLAIAGPRQTGGLETGGRPVFPCIFTSRLCQ
jgi:arabinogalactan oligomer / maltooligosaccharide transport system substrate-binding protein